MSQKKLLIASLLFLLTCAVLFALFLPFHEARVDELLWYFDDPAFKMLPARDVSIPIFSITYGTIIVYAILNRKEKYFISKMAFSYGLLLIFRFLTLSLLPLKEPETIVYLEDPFLNTFIYQGTIDSDLFFSGHTALVCLVFFHTKKWKWLFAVLGATLGVLLMIQRVHYSIDILAALPFAFLTVKIVDFAIYSRLKKG
ncbi:MAG: phosphatase PAP2-related protein [Crocinitomicaceae bacterium]